MYKNIYKILLEYTKNYLGAYYLRELQQKTGLALKTVQNALHYLEQEHILLSKYKGKHKYFLLNFQNPLAKLWLLQTEIERTKTFLKEQPFFNLFTKKLPSDSTIILFGSRAKGNARKHSDVDIFFISRKKLKLPTAFLPFSVHEVKISEKDFPRSVKEQETLIKEIEHHHVILHNPVTWVDVQWRHYAQDKNTMVFQH